MVEHSVSVVVKAPIDQVYQLFTHFNDFPKFMGFVKEVTYYDEQRSHWVVRVLNDYEWDAVNEDWIPNQQVGWRSTRGLRNSGKVKFRAVGTQRTVVDVYIQYTPPSGPLGQLGEKLGVNALFDEVLKKDLAHFARMVEEAPAGALDPMSSHYLFHAQSAATRKQITPRQQEAMKRDPMMAIDALAERQRRIEREAEERRLQLSEQETVQQQKKAEADRLLREQQLVLAREAERRRKEQQARSAALAGKETRPLDPRYTYAAWARGLGDKDGLRVRDPNFTRDPMTSRRPATHTEASGEPKISAE